MIEVIIADDHSLYRQGVIRLLKDTDDLHLTGEAESLSGLQKLLTHQAPNVLLLDLGFPDGNGLTILPDLPPHCGVVVVTMYHELLHIHAPLIPPVYGLVLKDDTFNDLYMAIRAAHRKERFISPALQQEKYGPLPREEERLTVREMEVLQLLANGESSRSAAWKLGVSAKTVEAHGASLRNKLGLRRTVDLVRYAAETGLLPFRRRSW
ncbi:MAG: response regulator transcription factor [Magnetococcales bacterium]|nr:response regulator transcription factor [Magnetococcales bacterium]NGZ25320.1 response regulator transcription factor [Magnetococcales bacterium]